MLQLQCFTSLCDSSRCRQSPRRSVAYTSFFCFLSTPCLLTFRCICASSPWTCALYCWRFERIFYLSSKEAQYRRRRGSKHRKLHHSIVAGVRIRRRSIRSSFKFVAQAMHVMAIRDLGKSICASDVTCFGVLNAPELQNLKLHSSHPIKDT